MKIKKFLESRRISKSPVSLEQFMECFQEYQDYVSNLDINVFQYNKKTLEVQIFFDDIVGENPSSVNIFRGSFESQRVLIPCIDRFESMYDCVLNDIDWASNEVSFKFFFH
jgi:hypothetical protein